MTNTTDTTIAGPEVRIGELLDRALDGTRVFPVEIVVRGRTGSRVVEVYVDSDDPIGSDDLAAISRELGASIETEDFIRGAWRLNVSTPGADRPLQDRRQYPKHAGRTLSVRWLPDGSGDERTTTGKLVGVEDDEIVLRTRNAGIERIPFPSVVESKVQLPW